MSTAGKAGAEKKINVLQSDTSIRAATCCCARVVAVVFALAPARRRHFARQIPVLLPHIRSMNSQRRAVSHCVAYCRRSESNLIFLPRPSHNFLYSAHKFKATDGPAQKKTKKKRENKKASTPLLDPSLVFRPRCSAHEGYPSNSFIGFSTHHSLSVTLLPSTFALFYSAENKRSKI